MKIFFQKEPNHCGFSIIQMVHFYLYKTEINNDLLIDHSYLYEKGISVYDLEVLANKFNVDLTSYETSFMDLVKAKMSKYFITILKDETTLHYVIAKRVKNGFLIFDSVNGKYFLTWTEFEKVFDKVVILFEKKQQFDSLAYSQIHNKKLEKYLSPTTNYFYYFLFISFDLLILFFNFLSSGLIKISFSLISTRFLEQILFVLIYFALVFVIEQLLTYWIFSFKTYLIKKQVNQNFIYYINYLNNKTKTYFYKTNKDEMYVVPVAFNEYHLFSNFEKPNLISNLLISFLLLFTFAYFSFYYLFFAFLYTLISLSINYIKKQFNNQHLNKQKLLETNLSYTLFKTFEFYEKEKNPTTKNDLVTNLKSLFFEKTNFEKYASIYHSKLDFFYNVTKRIIYLVILAIVFYFLTNYTNTTFNLPQLLFIFSLLAIFDTNTSNAFLFLTKYANHHKNKQYVKKYLSFENKIETTHLGIELDQIKNIKFQNLSFWYSKDKLLFDEYNIELKNNTLINGKNGVGKSTLLKLIALEINGFNQTKILFNDYELIQLNTFELENKMYYLTNFSLIINADFSKYEKTHNYLFNKVNLFMKEFDLLNKKEDEYSQGQKQLINLLHLVFLKNKIILLDEIFANLDEQITNKYLSNFWEEIATNNFVICVSHNLKISSYFSHLLNL